MARSKFKVYPSAYANAWAAKWYKKRGGGWSSVKTESFAQGISEEVVNKSHKGTMTEKEKARRDRIAKSVKGIRAIKGKDSEKNAKYRYATWIVLNMRKGEKGGKKKKKTK